MSKRIYSVDEAFSIVATSPSVSEDAAFKALKEARKDEACAELVMMDFIATNGAHIFRQVTSTECKELDAGAYYQRIK